MEQEEQPSANRDRGLSLRGPGFVSYAKDQFGSLAKQHNIMVLVGNGFDIQVLHEYEQQVDTRYEPFYFHLKMRGFDPENSLLMYMEQEKAGGRENWSDVEAAVAAAVKGGRESSERIFANLRAMQAEFADFLRGVVSNELLENFGADTVANQWSVKTLSEFLGDIADPGDFRSMEFPVQAGRHYGLFNFLFVNFNYTTLLDNYVYLDQVQFAPRKHETVDTNFAFRNDPRGHLHPSNVRDAGQSGYVLAEVVHPHGVLSTPRSLLFGIDAEDDYDKRRRPDNKLKKPYWAQCNVRYRYHFDQTELFIIFGCSLGDSDGWWWRHIARALANGESELIIYRRQDAGGHTIDSVKARFLEAAGLEPRDSTSRRVLSRIHVIVYDDSTERIFLSTRRRDRSSRSK